MGQNARLPAVSNQFRRTHQRSGTNYTARDDAAAVSRAEQTLNGADIEVWQADRFIVRVTPSGKVREPAFPKAAGAPRLLG
jgi:hypothetical protein